MIASIPFTTTWISVASFVMSVVGIGGLAGVYHMFECHVSDCKRLGRFPYEHYRFCRVHHPSVPTKGKIDPPAPEGEV